MHFQKKSLHLQSQNGNESSFGKAGVLKLVDNPDLGSGAERRGGSSPFARTKKSVQISERFFCFIPVGIHLKRVAYLQVEYKAINRIKLQRLFLVCSFTRHPATQTQSKANINTLVFGCMDIETNTQRGNGCSYS